MQIQRKGAAAFVQLGRPVLLMGFAEAHGQLTEFNVIY